MRFRQFVLSPQRIRETVYAWLKRELDRLFDTAYVNAQSLGINSKEIQINEITSLPYYKEQRFIFTEAVLGEVKILGEFTKESFLIFYTKGSGTLKFENQSITYSDDQVIRLYVKDIKPLTFIQL